MTFENNANAMSTPAILTPEVQQAVWFLGALVRVRASGDATAGRLDLLEHQAERGYASPVHRHLAEEETFFVLDGEVRVEVGGEAHAAAAGAVAVLPRQLPHAFVVTSPQARFLTLHTPGGFERFTPAVGTPVTGAARCRPMRYRPTRPPLRQWPVRTASRSSVRPRHRDSSSASPAPAGGRNPEAG
jgi:quercetin dioxygenase-like cupin family protein